MSQSPGGPVLVHSKDINQFNKAQTVLKYKMAAWGKEPILFPKKSMVKLARPQNCTQVQNRVSASESGQSL